MLTTSTTGNTGSRTRTAAFLFLVLNCCVVHHGRHGMQGMHGMVQAQENAPAVAACPVVDPNVDAFPDKVAVTKSFMWSIQYNNTYKILTNIDANETYLLYQCGSQPPTEPPVIPYKAIIEIPIKSIGVDQTPTIPFLEQLGLVDLIVAYTSSTAYISSPCLLDSIEQGNVLVALAPEEVDGISISSELTNETIAKLAQAIAFISPFGSEVLFQTSVKVSEYKEKSNAAIFEWIKYYSAFFNLEAKANEVFDLTQQRWECVAEEASRTTADAPTKPVVLWAYYSDYCGGWDTGECPNYYCEYAEQCSATLLGSTVGNYSETCFANFLSTEQLVELGKTADHWIYPSNNWNATYYLFKDKLDTMKPVADKQVFDYQAAGENAWFEQRYAEYFAVLQDFCSVVGTTTPLSGKTWFRHVFDGTPVGSVGTECTENSRSNSIVPVAGAECNVFQPSTPSTPVTNDTNANATPNDTNGVNVTADGGTSVATNGTNANATPNDTNGFQPTADGGTSAGCAMYASVGTILGAVLVGLL